MPVAAIAAEAANATEATRPALARDAGRAAVTALAAGSADGRVARDRGHHHGQLAAGHIDAAAAGIATLAAGARPLAPGPPGPPDWP